MVHQVAQPCCKCDGPCSSPQLGHVTWVGHVVSPPIQVPIAHSSLTELETMCLSLAWPQLLGPMLMASNVPWAAAQSYDRAIILLHLNLLFCGSSLLNDYSSGPCASQKHVSGQILHLSCSGIAASVCPQPGECLWNHGYLLTSWLSTIQLLLMACIPSVAVSQYRP